eukprot:491907-Rhodomonas_salina.1
MMPGPGRRYCDSSVLRHEIKDEPQQDSDRRTRIAQSLSTVHGIPSHRDWQWQGSACPQAGTLICIGLL